MANAIHVLFMILAVLQYCSGTLSIEWATCCWQSSTVCNMNTSVCRTSAHYVVNANTAASSAVRGMANFSLDGSSYQPAGAMVREMKPTTDHEGAVSQSINWGFDGISPYTEDTSELPRKICAGVWVQDMSTAQSGSLQPHCLTLGVSYIQSISSTDKTMLTYYDNVHSQAVSVNNGSRILVHVDVRAAAPNIVDSIAGEVVCSLNNITWDACGSVIYEQQIVSTTIDDEVYATQVFQWVYDASLSTLPDAFVPSQICFKVRLHLTDYPDAPMTWMAREGKSQGSESTVNCLPLIAM